MSVALALHCVSVTELERIEWIRGDGSIYYSVIFRFSDGSTIGVYPPEGEMANIPTSTFRTVKLKN
jgi:hypothetical protein